ncbi:Glucagon-like peptide 2 receptor [Labeo rohita]|uniref:Glucagon-like peptide 2 receptor n=1 Tax=Labeo rohita TaxID=84645 RepID=A0ABQ8M7X0_LABRO|nr:Glucagon-like peptide 2 receptor [Labeo rohita]
MVFMLPAGRRAALGVQRWTLIVLLYSSQVMGSTLDDLIYKRSEYQENCTRFLKATFPTGTGIFCNGTFDVFACWPHSSPGIVSVPCPPYLPWIKEGATGNVYKECTVNGTWKTEENSSTIWRNQSECEHDYFFKSKEEEMFRQTVLRVLSIVGYSLSFSSLCLAVLIMGLLRKLHCTRNYIHMNLFVSFIFRATAVIIKEVILQVAYTNMPRDEIGWNSYTKSTVQKHFFILHKQKDKTNAVILMPTFQISFICKASKVSLEYFVGCNYFWLLVEAIFLHTLLFTATVGEKQAVPRASHLMLITSSRERAGKHDNYNGSNQSFCITADSVQAKLLLSKLKADQVKFTDYRYSLARATLVLIPLLGVHEIVFTLIIDESVEGSSRYARNFINLTLSSFQGLLVAVLYCFANGEVQAELKKRWQLFISSNQFEVHNCFVDIHPKHLWKCSQNRPRQTTEQSESNEEGNHAPTQRHQQQVAVQSAEDVMCGRSSGLEFYMRKSLSSSDGEMTLGETMEEILEESEF